jgi:hypothetical protein
MWMKASSCSSGMSSREPIFKHFLPRLDVGGFVIRDQAVEVEDDRFDWHVVTPGKMPEQVSNVVFEDGFRKRQESACPDYNGCPGNTKRTTTVDAVRDDETRNRGDVIGQTR